MIGWESDMTSSISQAPEQLAPAGLAHIIACIYDLSTRLGQLDKAEWERGFSGQVEARLRDLDPEVRVFWSYSEKPGESELKPDDPIERAFFELNSHYESGPLLRRLMTTLPSRPHLFGIRNEVGGPILRIYEPTVSEAARRVPRTGETGPCGERAGCLLGAETVVLSGSRDLALRFVDEPPALFARRFQDTFPGPDADAGAVTRFLRDYFDQCRDFGRDLCNKVGMRWPDEEHERRKWGDANAHLIYIATYAAWKGFRHTSYVFPPASFAGDNRGSMAVFWTIDDPIVSVDASTAFLLSFVLGQNAAQLRTMHKESESSRRLAMGAYKIGHPLKVRADATRSALGEAILSLEEDPGAVRSWLEDAWARNERVRKLGHLLDLLSRVIESPGDHHFHSKADWREEEPYSLADGLSRNQELLLKGNARLVLDPQPGQKTWLDDVEVSGWITRPNERDCRPSNIFYDEILAELLTNAFRHMKVPVPDDRRVLVIRTEPSPDGPTVMLVFRNRCDPQETIERLQVGVDPKLGWTRFDINRRVSVGGFYYLAVFLQLTGVGTIWTRVTEGPDGADLDIGVQFKNLRFRTGRGDTRTDRSDDVNPARTRAFQTDGPGRSG
jgi:hypothetical protein